jgi:hypothetical protein
MCSCSERNDGGFDTRVHRCAAPGGTGAGRVTRIGSVLRVTCGGCGLSRLRLEHRFTLINDPPGW